MYKIVTKEDTIRIPAEYMRKGQSLDQHIDRLSMTAFEGRFDDDNRFILVTNNHQPLGRGRIIHGDGAIYQKVRFDAVLFCMDDYEVVEGAVSEAAEKTHGVQTLIRDGALKSFSVGFRVKDGKYNRDDDSMMITDVELLEISVVSVPCNQDSLFSIRKSFDSDDELMSLKSEE